MPAELYENNVISRGQLMIFTGGIILFGVILAGCIYYTGHSSATKDEPDEDETYMQVALPNTPETRLGEHQVSDLVVDLGRSSVALPHSVPLRIVD